MVNSDKPGFLIVKVNFTVKESETAKFDSWTIVSSEVVNEYETEFADPIPIYYRGDKKIA